MGEEEGVLLCAPHPFVVPVPRELERLALGPQLPEEVLHVVDPVPRGKARRQLLCALLALAGPPSPGPASAGARADDPLRLSSLTLCSDSEVALRLAGSCWASFSTVKHGQVPLPTRSCSS